MKKPLYTAKNIYFAYQKQLIFQNISFEVYEGDFFLVLGPSGSGKTTLLNLLLGKITPQEGNFFNLVPQDYFISEVSVYPDFINYLSVEDHLNSLFSPLIHENNKIFQKEKDNFLDYMNLIDKKNKAIHYLSSGERQRLALIEALLNYPDILIADEIFSFMDEKSKLISYEVLKFFQQKKNLTIILAGHDQDFFKTTSARFIYLQNGQIYKEGKACFI